MRRQSLNFTLDTISFLAMLTLLGTGLLMKFTLPPGSGAKTVWGLGRHDWGGLHFWIAIALIVALVLHIALHWGWVYASGRRAVRRGTARPRQPGRERAAGLAVLALVILLLSGFLAAARSSMVTGTGAAAESHGEREH